MHKLLLLFTSLVLSQFVFAKDLESDSFSPLTFSPAGDEYIVEFKGNYESNLRNPEVVKNWTESQKQNFTRSVMPTFRYLFGPLTHRSMGGIKENLSLNIDWEKIYKAEGKVYFPYTYRGLWLFRVDLSLVGGFEIPVPLNKELLNTKDWLNCTDSAPEHQTESFYWYFWDPTRYGCDHKEGKHFVTTHVSLDKKTEETTFSFPEYQRMLVQENAGPLQKMTIAFGYVDDNNIKDPETDFDQGASEYRKFKRNLSVYLKSLAAENLISTPILISEYDMGSSSDVIGQRITFTKKGIRFEIKVVINARIDQMYLFAKSYAHDHDSYFAWLGHSRVGSGFDAWQFKNIITTQPDYYSISSDYQLVYWGGCNSYSYYTLPFFEMKHDLDPENDPHGSKNLDIIANTLPSLFIFNAQNALIQVRSLINSQVSGIPTSYQQILQETETFANQWGTQVLTVVLGDEDNAQ